MYPNLYFAFLDLLGLDLPGLKLINSFGFFVALAFVVGARIMRSEIARKEGEGLFTPGQETVTIGAPVSWLDVGLQALTGFVFGWKFLYLLLNAERLFAGGGLPQAHLFSGEGSIGWGLALAVVFGGWRYWAAAKEALPEPKRVTRAVPSTAHVSAIVTAAAVGGIAGAKLFHLLEYPDQLVAFFTEPSLSGFLGGLTIYGGLIVGALAVAWVARRKGMKFLPLADAAAPALILAYGVGRIGCQVSGDGDWGIANSAPKPGWMGWLPDWLWAYHYPNNVNGMGVLIGENDPWPVFEGFGTYLQPAVFPTPLYETLMATAIFGVLWALRKRIRIPGQLFSIYLVFNGLERFLIEQIRVNVEMEALGLTFTQAELIAVLTFVGGGMLWWILGRTQAKPH